MLLTTFMNKFYLIVPYANTFFFSKFIKNVVENITYNLYIIYTIQPLKLRCNQTTIN